MSKQMSGKFLCSRVQCNPCALASASINRCMETNARKEASHVQRVQCARVQGSNIDIGKQCARVHVYYSVYYSTMCKGTCLLQCLLQYNVQGYNVQTRAYVGVRSPNVVVQLINSSKITRLSTCLCRCALPGSPSLVLLTRTGVCVCERERERARARARDVCVCTSLWACTDKHARFCHAFAMSFGCSCTPFPPFF